jgi:hypothetical protein
VGAASAAAPSTAHHLSLHQGLLLPPLLLMWPLLLYPLLLLFPLLLLLLCCHQESLGLHLLLGPAHHLLLDSAPVHSLSLSNCVGYLPHIPGSAHHMLHCQQQRCLHFAPTGLLVAAAAAAAAEGQLQHPRWAPVCGAAVGWLGRLREVLTGWVLHLHWM